MRLSKNLADDVLLAMVASAPLLAKDNFSKDEVFDLIRKEGIEPTFRINRRVVGTKKTFFGRTREAKQAERVYDLGNMGHIPEFDQLSVYVEIHVDGKKVKVVPTGVSFGTKSPCGGMSYGGRDDRHAEKLILPYFPAVDFELPEELVQLPIPSWIEVEVNQGEWVGLNSLWRFRSKAEALTQEFAQSCAKLKVATDSDCAACGSRHGFVGYCRSCGADLCPPQKDVCGGCATAQSGCGTIKCSECGVVWPAPWADKCNCTASLY